MEQPELFEDVGESEKTAGVFEPDENGRMEGPADLVHLFELSVDAYYAAIYARMSELPIKENIKRFVEKVNNAGKSVDGKIDGCDRDAAARAAFDRGDPDVLAVLIAAGKVQHEIHRLTGLLRFKEGEDGVYTASCAPDHYILPALAEHFTLRFGEMPWAIIDEKRSLCLSWQKEGNVSINHWSPDATASPEANAQNSWEALWRLYHRSVNIKARKNLHLQRQLMPLRYQEYLTEIEP